MDKIVVEEIIPAAKRLINSLRDIGYSFATAVADLVDNSITAKATEIEIIIEFNGEKSFLCIADNGIGMSREKLIEAMRYGSNEEYDNDDLGKFGLGLKTASLSQCQRLVVASRMNSASANINAFCWDLDHIEQTNRWEVIDSDTPALNAKFNKMLKNSCGTVVYWYRLDRIVGYKYPKGDSAKKRLLAMCRELEEHLSMVFHRFLSGEVPGRRIKIVLNGHEVRPWDPFARHQPKTRIFKSEKIRLEYEGNVAHVIVEPFVLPHQDDFRNLNEHKNAAGPKNWNLQQGFYIYRGNRMIQSGGWNKFRTVDEHLKLARVGISFTPELDEAFNINVAKMRVKIPEQIHAQLEAITRPVIRAALETYKRKMEQTCTTAKNEQQKTSQEVTKLGKSTYTGNNLLSIDEIEKELDPICSDAEKLVVKRVFIRLREKLRHRGN